MTKLSKKNYLNAFDTSRKNALKTDFDSPKVRIIVNETKYANVFTW